MRLLCVLLLCCGLTAPAVAQGWDDAGDGGGAIVDPELQGVAPPPAPLPELPPPASDAGTGEIRVTLRNRTAMDVFFQDPREDVLTSTFLASFEATVRRSERTHFVVGARPIYRVASRQHSTPDQDAVRYELDVLPSAAHADLNPADGVHLRLGYQYQHLGRFDVFSAQNVLSAYDLRDGPTTMPEAAELAQPAARVDWDPNMWLSLRAVYLPFHQPHLVNYTDGDFALAPQTQAEVDASIDASVGGDPVMAIRQRQRLKASIGRRAQEQIARTGFSAFAPDSDLSRPQGALRAVAHGPVGELGLSLVTANERLPVPHYDPALLAVLAADAEGRTDVAAEAQLATVAEPFEVRYPRFFVTAADGATQLGPVQVGAELAVMWNRTLFAAHEGDGLLPGRTDIAQGSVRLEYLRGQTLALVSEAFWATMLSTPDDPQRAWLMADRGRHLWGALGFCSWAMPQVGLTWELGIGAMSGPSYALLPRVQYEASSELFVEAGAQFINGDKPKNLTVPKFSLGGRYDDTDQVYVGLRYLP